MNRSLLLSLRRAAPLVRRMTAWLALAGAPLLHAQLVVTRTFTPGLVVDDLGEAADVRTFDVGGGTINSLQVDVVLSAVTTPLYNGDYYISIGRGSTTSVLLNRPGVTNANPDGYGDNGIAATFADVNSSATPNPDVHFYRTAPGGPSAGNTLTGTWAPDGRLTDPLSPARPNMLSNFVGAPASGEWRLFISDEAASGGNSARVDLWRLRMSVTPDGTTQMQLADAQLAADSAQTVANPIQVSGTSRVSGANNVTLTGVLSGSGTLTKEDGGTLTLAQPNGFAGALAVTGGTLQLPSGIDGPGGAINIGVGGTLEASGSITRDLTHQGTISGPAVGSGQLLTLSGTVTGAGNYAGRILMNGTFSPGNSPAITSFNGDALLGSLNLLNLELGGITPGSQHDQLFVTQTLTLGGTLQISLINGYSPTSGESFQVFDAGAITGTFSSFVLPTLPGLTWDTSRLGSQGVLGVTISAIPEPGAVALGFGGAALALAAWRRRQKQISS